MIHDNRRYAYQDSNDPTVQLHSVPLQPETKILRRNSTCTHIAIPYLH